VWGPFFAAGIQAIVAVTPFWSQTSPLHTFLEPPVEGFYNKFPFLEEFCQNLSRPKQKGSSCRKDNCFVQLLSKNLYNSMVFDDGLVQRHISYVKKLSGFFKLGLVTVTKIPGSW